MNVKEAPPNNVTMEIVCKKTCSGHFDGETLVITS